MSRPLAAVSVADLFSVAARIVTGRAFGLALAALAIAAGVATYSVVVAGLLPRRLLQPLLVADAVLVGLLSVVVAVRVASAWFERRRGAAGSRLHVRLVLLFGLFAVAPTIVLAVMSPLFFTVLQENLLGRAKVGLASARALADEVVRAQEDMMRRDLGAVAATLQQLPPSVLSQSDATGPLLRTLADGRGLVELTVLDRARGVVASALGPALGPGDASRPPEETLSKAVDEAQPIFFFRQGRPAAYAVMQLFTGEDLFLVVGHSVDPTIWFQHRVIVDAQNFYEVRDANLGEVQLVVFSIYGAIALLMLLSAVSVGIVIASRMTEPIGRLVGAADRVRQGDLTARVEEGPPDDELGNLARSFNRMTGQLQEQRHDLIDANRQLDERRRLVEAVLAGVSAGVISLDADGRIDRANRSAAEILGVERGTLEGRVLVEELPEFGEALDAARSRPDRQAQRQVAVERGGRARTLLVRIEGSRGDSGPSGYVATFDDISELMSAQRMAAWADVARRIAHEIKNPLTPIQLSAERLKRRYLKQIKDDPETFTTCTDTIIRQVGDIGRMVDEFSSFARMPRPTLQQEDLRELCHQAVFLQRNALPEIAFTTALPDGPLVHLCDRRQIGQALTNLLKNAAEAIEGRETADGSRPPPGEIRLALVEDGKTVRVVVEDNGRGLPREGRARLAEPYVTTRAKGTGLGLAIVKKIMEDHGGELVLADREGGGARVSLVFHRRSGEGAEPQGDAPRTAAAG